MRPPEGLGVYRRGMAVARTRRARADRRRKKRLARTVHDLTVDQWAALKEAWGGCAYCGDRGVPLQRDCVLPVSRGGRYTLENVVPACRACNASKGNTEVTAWLRRKHLDEQAFLIGHLTIHLALAAPAVP